MKRNLGPLLILLAGNFCLTQGHTADVKNSANGFLDFNFYPYLTDVDSDSVFTLNTGANLPNRFQYFSLISLSNQASKSEFEDTEYFYTEQNIRWQISENSPFDLTLQHNMRSNVDNDRLRLGFRWRLDNTNAIKPFFEKIHLNWSINFHILQLDHQEQHVWQMEHVARLLFPYLTDRLYLSGFADHSFGESNNPNIPKNPIAAEAQLGYRLFENFFFITEYRLNEYRREDVNNIAVGVEYKIVW